MWRLVFEGVVLSPFLVNRDQRRNQEFTWGAADEAHGERGARGYNGGLGAEPPAGSRGRAPGQGVRGRNPPEAQSFFVDLGKLAPFWCLG